MKEQKLEGLVLKEFYEKDYKELEKDYQVLVEEYRKRKFGLEFSKKEIEFVSLEVLPNIKWKGTEVYGINELRKIITKVEPEKLILVERESVRALFHYLSQYQGVGTEFIDIEMKILENVSLVVKEINEYDTIIRDASTELEAKRQGIDPETLRTSEQESPEI